MKSRVAGFVFLLTLAAVEVSQAQETSLTSTFGTASVDGTFSPGEWDSALRVPVFGESLPGSAAFIMNDEQNIYFAFQAPDSTLSPNDTFAVRFDNAHNGTIDVGDDEILLSPGNYRDTHYGDGYGVLDPLQSGVGGTSSNGTMNFFEVSHPLNSGDVNDIALSAGDTVGLAFRYSLDGIASATQTTFPPRSFSLGNRQLLFACLLYTSPSPRDATLSRMPSSA